MGVCTSRFACDGRQPGWDSESYGYHGDDGRLFHGNGTQVTLTLTLTLARWAGASNVLASSCVPNPPQLGMEYPLHRIHPEEGGELPRCEAPALPSP